MLASRGRIYFGTFNDLSHEAPPLNLCKQFHSDKSPTSLFCALTLAYARRNHSKQTCQRASMGRSHHYAATVMMWNGFGAKRAAPNCITKAISVVLPRGNRL
jgi:hypothetical protein